MLKKYLVVITAIFCCHAITSAQSRQKVDKRFHLYILMGQSNMAGRGPITDELKAISNPRVYSFDKKGEWVTAKNPLHFDKPTVVAVGPGLSFGIEMAKQDTTVKIGLIPCAVGGTSINVWKPGAYDKSTNTHPYDDAVLRIKEAMKYGVIKGLIWHQGEADSNPPSATYLEDFKALISRIRILTKNKKLPVVAGELGRFQQRYIDMNRELAKIPDFVKYTAFATSEELKDKGDQTHFDGKSANEYGKRYAEKMKGLQTSK